MNVDGRSMTSDETAGVRRCDRPVATRASRDRALVFRSPFGRNCPRIDRPLADFPQISIALWPVSQQIDRPLAGFPTKRSPFGRLSQQIDRPLADVPNKTIALWPTCPRDERRDDDARRVGTSRRGARVGMHRIKSLARSLKRAVLGSSSDDEDAPRARASSNESSSRRRKSSRGASTPVVESAVSELSGIACGGVQGLGWVKEREVTDEDGDVADGFVVCEERAPARTRPRGEA